MTFNDLGRTFSARQYAVPCPPAEMMAREDREGARRHSHGPGHLSVPLVEGLVRSRLTARLDESGLARLCMVVAPAGAGKTTLLAHWARRTVGDVAWYRADAAHNTEEAVIANVGAALAMLSPGPAPHDLQTMVAAVERRGSPLVLVVDDWHLVEHTRAGHFLQRLLLSAPLHLRLLVGSRRAPSFNLARSEVPALILGEEDLRFRPSETSALFRDIYGRPLPAALVEQLTRVTEGWAAGLRLFYLSAAPTGRAQQRSLNVGEVRFASDYLESQVLGDLPNKVVHFLRRTSCFERLTPQRCDDLLDECGSRRILEGLEKRGAMVSSDGGVTFRVHGVLRRHLATQLLDELDQSSARAWFRRAATVLRMDQEYASAVRLLVRVGDWEGTEELLGRHGERILVEPVPWVEVLPAPIIHGNPWLLLARARRLLDKGDVLGAVRDARQVAACATDPGAQRLAHRTLELAHPWLSDENARQDTCAGQLRAATVSVSRPRSATRGSAEECASQGLVHALAGDFRSAERILRRASSTAGDQRTRMVARLAEALVADDSGSSAQTLLADESLPDQPWLARIAEALAWCRHPSPDESDRQDEWARRQIEERELAGDHWGALILEGIRAVSRLRAGHADAMEFETLVARCHAVESPTLEAWARAGLALVACHSNLPDAYREAEAAEAFARMANVPGAMALAYAALAEVSPDEGRELLRLAETTATEAGLNAHPWTWLRDGSEALNLMPVPEPRRRSVAVVREPPPVSVRCFGRFELRLSGDEPDLGAIRPRARAVLRLLALRAGRPVHRELLVDALWRELDPVAATHNLHVSVSSLRVALEPGVPRGANRIVVRDAERYQLSMPPGSFSDIVEFERCVSEGYSARRSGESTDAIASLEQALYAYTGDVLPEDGPADWVIGTREHYRMRVAEAAATLAELHLARHDPSAAAAAALRSLDVDPCRDASWRLLLSAYSASGDLAAAEQARRSYADVLTSLGVVTTSAAAVLPQSRRTD